MPIFIATTARVLCIIPLAHLAMRTFIIYETDITRRRLVIIQTAKHIDIAPFVDRRGNSSLFISRAVRAHQVRSIELHLREMEASGIKASPARKCLFGDEERQDRRDALAGMPG